MNACGYSVLAGWDRVFIHIFCDYCEWLSVAVSVGLHCDQHSSVITAQWDGSLLTPATSCYCHCGHNPLSPRIIIVLIRKYDDAERVSWCHVVLPCVFVCKKCSWCELC